VSYLLVGNGANGTTTNIKDSSSNNYATTAFGNTVISTAISPPAITNSGSGTVYFDGTGDYVTANGAALPSGTGDFTVECWINIPNTNTTKLLIGEPSGNSNSLAVRLGVNYNSGNGNGIQVSRSFVADNEYCNYNFTINTWYHIAITRLSGTINFFVAGVKQTTLGSGASSFSFVQPTTAAIGDPGNLEPMNGYVYDLRITKNVARYTASYTPPPLPPTSAFPTY
jgi:hypothetical protein